MFLFVSKFRSPIFLNIPFGQASIVLKHNLCMAQGTVLEFQILQFFVQSLMLANLAHVVLFNNDAHATGNAGRKVATTVLARDVANII